MNDVRTNSFILVTGLFLQTRLQAGVSQSCNCSTAKGQGESEAEPSGITVAELFLMLFRGLSCVLCSAVYHGVSQGPLFCLPVFPLTVYTAQRSQCVHSVCGTQSAEYHLAQGTYYSAKHLLGLVKLDSVCLVAHHFQIIFAVVRGLQIAKAGLLCPSKLY